MSQIESLHALQILDSRGVPTLRVFLKTRSGVVGVASVPSGASTGSHEALELRDGDQGCFLGKGVLKALSHVDGPLASLLQGMEVSDQQALDRAMIDADGTPDKSKWGANAILGVSMAACRAASLEAGLPLYRYLAQTMGGKGEEKSAQETACHLLPCPMLNIINGGAHADNTIDCQEFMIRPVGAASFSEGLRWACEVYAHLKKILKQLSMSTGVGDEGGFAPQLGSDEHALELIVKAIHGAGYQPGEQITLALDCASSSFYEGGLYLDKKKLIRALPGTRRTTQQQIDLLKSWTERYPIDTIEDGLAESDWEGFAKQTEQMGKTIQIVGDDLLVTNPHFVRRAVEERSVNSVLIKLNQIGTVWETFETVKMAHQAGLRTVISHRSGETEDTFIADLVVATASGQIKTGAPCRTERVAKYNRLLEIEAELHSQARYAGRG